MKYDDASWHYGGDFPSELPDSAGATHIGMFLAWALLNDLGGELHTDDFVDDLDQLREKAITPGEYLWTICDQKFTDEDLSEDGNAFASAYYASDEAPYIGDYCSVFDDPDTTSIYHVPDSWESYDRLAPIVSARFAEWKSTTAGS